MNTTSTQRRDGVSNIPYDTAVVLMRGQVDAFLDRKGPPSVDALPFRVRSAIQRASWSSKQTTAFEALMTVSSAFEARGLQIPSDVRREMPAWADQAIAERPDALLTPCTEREPEETPTSALGWALHLLADPSRNFATTAELGEAVHAETVRAKLPNVTPEAAVEAAADAFHETGRSLAEGELAEARRAADERYWADEAVAWEADAPKREAERLAYDLAAMSGVNAYPEPADLMLALLHRVPEAGHDFCLYAARRAWGSWGADDLSETVVADVVEVAPKVPLGDLTRPPGLVGAIVDWIADTSERPSRELALGAALGFVGALGGRRYASETNLRTNLMITALAASGFGKNHALDCVKRLAIEGQFERFLGPARIMSASALRKVAKTKGSALMMIDEVGGFFRQITDKRSGLHNSLIKNDLLEFFSSAGSMFMGAEYAGEAAEPIYSPNICVYGTSTPEDFWSGLTSLSGDDGLLARFILFNVTGDRPAVVEPKLPARYVPPELIEWAGRILKATPIGNLETQPTPREVPYGEGAKSIITALSEKVDTRRGKADSAGNAILNRVAEHAIKLALTVAVGENPERPVISVPVMDWAAQVAWRSATTLMIECRDRIADNSREAAFNKVLRLIKEAGPEGLAPGKITDHTRGLDKRTRTEVLNDLIETGRVRFVEVGGVGGRGRKRQRYVATGRAISS